MDQKEKVIFVELRREFFELIVDTLRKKFPDLQCGSQGDDWIWIERNGIKIEIDSFYSSELEVKGPRSAYGLAKEISDLMSYEWIARKYDKPRIDLTE